MNGNKKMSDAAKLRAALHPKPTKKVICLETGIIYNSVKEAQELTGLKSIGANIHGKTTIVKKNNTHWRYYEDK